MLTLYHRTSEATARKIIANGFRDGRGHYLTDSEHSGVWLSDKPLNVNEGAVGDTIQVVTFADGAQLEDFEWVEEGKRYREWLVSADLINRVAKVEMFEEPEW
jgi:hypothetical protein